MGQEILQKALLKLRPENAKRRRGRCSTRCRDAVERNAKPTRMDQDLVSMAADDGATMAREARTIGVIIPCCDNDDGVDDDDVYL